MSRPDITELKKKAIEIRKDIIRMLTAAGSGLTGGSLSIVEILIALYYYALKNDPKNALILYLPVDRIDPVRGICATDSQ